jgi:hypothetical protein
MVKVQTLAGLGRALVRDVPRSEYSIIFIHGAGLEPTHPFYLSLISSLDPRATVFAPFTSATHFLAFGSSFRRREGWASHRPQDVLKELLTWVEHVSSDGQRLVMMGHSWGGHLAAQLSEESDLCLVSPIADLRSIVEVNWPSSRRPTETDAWLETEPNAPFPFLRGTLVETARGGPRTPDLLRRRSGRTLILFGEKEHPKISEWTVEIGDMETVTVRRLRGQGHFYGCDGAGVAQAFQDWAT